MVRVAGYSAFFTALSPDAQDQSSPGPQHTPAKAPGGRCAYLAASLPPGR
ncbi:hypothetical protein ACNKHO_05060 [Shigella flexneri]